MGLAGSQWTFEPWILLIWYCQAFQGKHSNSLNFLRERRGKVKGKIRQSKGKGGNSLKKVIGEGT